MLTNFLIFSLFWIGSYARGQFCVLSCPESLSFMDSTEINGDTVDDILHSSAGNSIIVGKEWDGLKINNPFDLPRVVSIGLEGIEGIEFKEKVKCYAMTGSYSSNSHRLADLPSSDNFNVVDIDLNEIDGSFQSYTSLSRQSLEEIPLIEPTKYLKSELHSEDKQFLRAIEWIKLLSSVYASSETKPDILTIHLSLGQIIKTHGANSDAVSEALDKIIIAINTMRNAIVKSSEVTPLIVTIASKDEHLREKRQSQKDDSLNLAGYYSEDYPVIFNIILWFMIVFGFALLAICYSVAMMDPGRDSIIYRMTSRMKKDN